MNGKSLVLQNREQLFINRIYLEDNGYDSDAILQKAKRKLDRSFRVKSSAGLWAVEQMYNKAAETFSRKNIWTPDMSELTGSLVYRRYAACLKE